MAPTDGGNRWDSRTWTKYAADCAERVLPLTGAKRPQAEAAIVAARAWANNPTKERRNVARQIIAETESIAFHLDDDTTEGKAASLAMMSAALSAKVPTVLDEDATAMRAESAAINAALIADISTVDAEQQWHAKRRHFYAL